MIRIQRSSSNIAIGLLLSLSLGVANGDTLNISNVPLFTATAVEPNVFFVLDDSWSMESDILTKDYDNSSFIKIGPIPYRSVHAMYSSYVYGPWLPLMSQQAVETYNAANPTDPLSSEYDGIWRSRNKDFNLLYYNPDVYYRPWKGVNVSGVTYPDYDGTSPPVNAYEGGTGTAFDLKSTSYGWDTYAQTASGTIIILHTSSYYVPRYYEWTDSNGNGVVDASDAHQLIEIRRLGTCSSGASCPSSFTRAATRTDCTVSGASASCSAAQELQNFANWWVYHRSRDRAMKAALSDVIYNSSNVRMGMSTIHNNAARMEIATMGTASNKSSLMSRLFQYKGISAGTPLKAGLERAGNYFACNGSAVTTSDTHFTYYPSGGSAGSVTSTGNLFGNTNCPIVTSANGGACQQNFTVLLTDGYDTAHGTSETWRGYPSAPSDPDWTSMMGGGSTSVQLYNDPFTVTSSVNADANSASSFDGGAYADSYADTLADVAMYFYKTDLSTTLSNDVPTQSGVDENNAQHMVTFSVALGMDGTINAMPTDASAPFAWPDPNAGMQQKLDDLRHAAYNGRGKFFNAKNPNELITALNNTVTSISDRTGAAAAVAFNTTTLSTDTDVYLALFNSTRWSGDLIAYGLDPNTGIISNSPTWNAGDLLDTRSYTGRNIFTFDGSAGLAFNSFSNLTRAQQDDLNTDASGNNDRLGSARFNYIRGYRGDENSGNNFRIRDSVLGDIVHAGPVYVGQPNLGWGDVAPFPTSATYTDFSTNLVRDSVVYVGANDGMLHAFKASDGSEEFAYIPNMMYSTATGAGLHYLTETGYAHRYYVDMTPSISDVFVNGAWKTVLVGAVRSGARGLFALDVTHPEAFTAANVMGEFTSANDANLGYTFSRPHILMTNAVGSSGEKRWAIIFGNGVNSGGTGRPALFLIFLDNDLSNGWNMGPLTTDDYIRLDVPANSNYGDTSAPNGLFTPSVVDIFDSAGASGSNGTADRVYAGDLLGNLWAFDISSTNPANWGVLHQTRGGTVVKAPLFVAAGQPITSSPVVARKPSSSSLIVMFGSGRYITSSDPSNTNTMGFYGVYDDGSQANLTSSNLQVQTLGTTASGYRTISDTAVGNSKSGWYIALSGGERVVTDPVVRGSLVYFNTTIPSTAACSTGGSGWLMSVDYINGGTPDRAVFDVNGDNVVNDSDLINGAAPVGKAFDQGIPASSTMLGDRRYTPGTETSNGGDVTSDQIQSLDSGNTGRLSWEQMKPPY